MLSGLPCWARSGWVHRIVSTTSQRQLGESDSPIEDELEAAFNRMVDEGSQRLHRSWREVLVTGFFGGTEVAIGVLAYLSVLHETHNQLLAGLAFSIGFLALLLGRSELFTEGFLVPVTTVAAKRASVAQLAKLWSGTLVANLVGGWVIMALIIAAFPPSSRRKPLNPQSISYVRRSRCRRWRSRCWAAWRSH